jgi:hypothetical protein
MGVSENFGIYLTVAILMENMVINTDKHSVW